MSEKIFDSTLVTALFDINREHKGDGRKIDEYLSWFYKTLQLNCNLFVIIEEKFKTFVELHRPKNYNTFVFIDKLENYNYYKYYNDMKKILESQDYKNRIKDPTRVECNLIEYNIIQYSKFDFLEKAININPFNTSYFFWIDAGISRFFLDVNISNGYPSNKIIKESNNLFIIQKRFDLNNYNIDDDIVWDSVNLLKGSMFGGHKDIITKINKLLENIFVGKMLRNNNVNNEQVGLALLYKYNPELFYIIDDNRHFHLILFKQLSLN